MVIFVPIIPIKSFVSIKEMYYKEENYGQMVLPLIEQIEREPIISQIINSDGVVDDRHNKYVQVFHRFTSRAAQIGTHQFNKIFNVFKSLVEHAEQNKIDDYMKNHNHNFVDQDLALANNRTPCRSISINFTERSIISATKSLSSTMHSMSSPMHSMSPFTLVACRNPVGRPKGRVQAATSFRPPIDK